MDEKEIYEILMKQEELDRKKIRKVMTEADKTLDKELYFKMKGVRGKVFDAAYQRFLHRRR